MVTVEDLAAAIHEGHQRAMPRWTGFLPDWPELAPSVQDELLLAARFLFDRFDILPRGSAMPEFLGYFDLGATVTIPMRIVNDVGTPKDPAVNPTFRIYENGVLVPNQVGSLAKIDTKVVTNATNATPIVITTSVAHGFQTGDRVTVANVVGAGGANGDFTITKVGETTFSLNGSIASGAYTSGGVAHVTGMYGLTLILGAGFTASGRYFVAIDWTETVARSKSGLFIVT
jgi:hypothetical protein